MSDKPNETHDESTAESASQCNVVYLMRGLPSCGKSTTAKRLAGKTGTVCSTDQYFYTEIGDDPTRYDYDKTLADEAAAWNFQRFRAALEQQISPVVVDRGNGLNYVTKRYAEHAIAQGYDVQLKEPDSPWWQEIRVLLKYKDLTKSVLDEWAQTLSRRNRQRTPAIRIRRLMEKWRHDITVSDILQLKPASEALSLEASKSES